jgi:hypothetical protein
MHVLIPIMIVLVIGPLAGLGLASSSGPRV